MTKENKMIPKYDPFNPYYDNEGNPLEKPLYQPKYIKTRFKFPPDVLGEVITAIEKGEYHTTGQYLSKEGKSTTHAFLILQLVPTEVPDEYLCVSEDYGPVQ